MGLSALGAFPPLPTALPPGLPLCGVGAGPCRRLSAALACALLSLGVIAAGVALGATVALGWAAGTASAPGPDGCVCGRVCGGCFGGCFCFRGFLSWCFFSCCCFSGGFLSRSFLSRCFFSWCCFSWCCFSGGFLSRSLLSRDCFRGFCRSCGFGLGLALCRRRRSLRRAQARGDIAKGEHQFPNHGFVAAQLLLQPLGLHEIRVGAEQAVQMPSEAVQRLDLPHNRAVLAIPARGWGEPGKTEGLVQRQRHIAFGVLP